MFSILRHALNNPPLHGKRLWSILISALCWGQTKWMTTMLSQSNCKVQKITKLYLTWFQHELLVLLFLWQSQWHVQIFLLQSQSSGIVNTEAHMFFMIIIFYGFIPTPQKVIGNSLGVGKAKFLEVMYDNKPEFPWGERVCKTINLPWGEYDRIFSGTAHGVTMPQYLLFTSWHLVQDWTQLWFLWFFTQLQILRKLQQLYGFYDFSLCCKLIFTKFVIFCNSHNFHNFCKIRSCRWAFSATNLANIHLATNLMKIASVCNSHNFRKNL